LHVDDLAEACYFLMLHYNEEGLVNVGVGEDLTILELAQLIKKITGLYRRNKIKYLKTRWHSKKIIRCN
jgi:nucleoside-diphosphate-sugar epimerase